MQLDTGVVSRAVARAPPALTLLLSPEAVARRRPRASDQRGKRVSAVLAACDGLLRQLTRGETVLGEPPRVCATTSVYGSAASEWIAWHETCRVLLSRRPVAAGRMDSPSDRRAHRRVTLILTLTAL